MSLVNSLMMPQQVLLTLAVHNKRSSRSMNETMAEIIEPMTLNSSKKMMSATMIDAIVYAIMVLPAMLPHVTSFSVNSTIAMTMAATIAMINPTKRARVDMPMTSESAVRTLASEAPSETMETTASTGKST